MREFTADNLRVYMHDTRDAMGDAAAEDAAARLRGILGEKERATVVFAAAPSQNEMLRALRGEDLPWERIVALHMDEYIGLPPGAPQRFASFLQDAIWRGLPFRAVYEMGELADAAAECVRYAAILRNNPPDLILCGVGENGHLAFNDPWVADFEDPADVKAVELDEVCRRQQVHDGCFPALADVPKRAITLTLPVFARAPQIVCVVPAASKADAVYHAVHAPISTEHPCTMLRRHPNAALYCDRDSGGRLV